MSFSAVAQASETRNCNGRQLRTTRQSAQLRRVLVEVLHLRAHEARKRLFHFQMKDRA